MQNASERAPDLDDLMLPYERRDAPTNTTDAGQGGMIRLPSHVVEHLQQLNAAELRLASDKYRDPTPEELAMDLEWTTSHVETLIRQRRHTISLGVPSGAEVSMLDDFIKNSIQDPGVWTPDNVAVKILMREDVVDAIWDIPSRLRFALALRFGLMGERKHTLKEAGRKLDVTHGRVWQLEKQALGLLKKSWKLSLFKENPPPKDFIQYILERRGNPDRVAVKMQMREDVVNALVDALPPRLRLVLSFRLGFIDDRPRTLEEVGRELRVTRERVRQLEKQAFGMLGASDTLLLTPKNFIHRYMWYMLERRWSLDGVALNKQMREDVANALVDVLPPPHRLALAFRFGFIDDRPRTLEDVGREMGITREHARQMENQALTLLKESGKLPRSEDMELE